MQRATLRVGQRPWGIALSPDGRQLYTANGPSNDVSVVDVAAWRVIGTLRLGQRPWGIAAGPPCTADAGGATPAAGDHR